MYICIYVYMYIYIYKEVMKWLQCRHQVQPHPASLPIRSKRQVVSLYTRSGYGPVRLTTRRISVAHEENEHRCRANMAQARQSRQDSGVGVQVKPFKVFHLKVLHQRSARGTWLAATRLSPTPPVCWPHRLKKTGYEVAPMLQTGYEMAQMPPSG